MKKKGKEWIEDCRWVSGWQWLPWTSSWWASAGKKREKMYFSSNRDVKSCYYRPYMQYRKSVWSSDEFEIKWAWEAVELEKTQLPGLQHGHQAASTLSFRWWKSTMLFYTVQSPLSNPLIVLLNVLPRDIRTHLCKSCTSFAEQL